MTESKMLRILVDLAAKDQDYGVFYLIDTWQTDETKKVREIIKISDIVEEFKRGEGRFYSKYKFNSDFKELVKILKEKKEFEIEVFYKDTYENYKKQWEKDHPNEGNFETWQKRQNKQRKRKFIQYLGSLGLYDSELIKKYYM